MSGQSRDDWEISLRDFAVSRVRIPRVKTLQRREIDIYIWRLERTLTHLLARPYKVAVAVTVGVYEVKAWILFQVTLCSKLPRLTLCWKMDGAAESPNGRRVYR